jgi:hypothetical protein
MELIVPSSFYQQNRYVFDVIVTSSGALFVFCISWNFARDISTVFKEINHLRSCAPDNIPLNLPQNLGISNYFRDTEANI